MELGVALGGILGSKLSKELGSNTGTELSAPFGSSIDPSRRYKQVPNLVTTGYRTWFQTSSKLGAKIRQNQDHHLELYLVGTILGI